MDLLPQMPDDHVMMEPDPFDAILLESGTESGGGGDDMQVTCLRWDASNSIAYIWSNHWWWTRYYGSRK